MESSHSQNRYHYSRNASQANGLAKAFGHNRGEAPGPQDCAAQYQQSTLVSSGDRSFPQFCPSTEMFQEQQEVVLDGTSGKIIMPLDRAPDLEANTMSRFWNSQDPWAPQGLDVSLWSTTGDPTVRPGPSYPGYRAAGALSNPDSHITQGQQDSGYMTADHRSNFSEHVYEGEESQSLIEGANRMGLYQDNFSPVGTYHEGPSYAGAEPYVEKHTLQEPAPHVTVTPQTCHHPQCRTSKKTMNSSEYKKHMQKHNKPFKCGVAGCARAEGFTTKNDLDRHMKSLHKINPSNGNDRSFICQGTQCNKKSKVWPRLDNFKSHCNRMHKTENTDDLVKKSERIGVDNLSSDPDRTEHNEEQPRLDHEEATHENGANLLMVLSQGGDQGRQAPHPNMPQAVRSNGPSHTAHARDFSGPHTPRIDVDNSMYTDTSENPNTVHPPDFSHMNPPSSVRHSQETRAPAHFSAETPRSPKSNEALAEAMQNSNSNSRTKSHLIHVFVSQEKLHELSQSLASTLAAHININPGYVLQEHLQSIMSREIAKFLNASKSNKRTSDEAGLDNSMARPKKVSCTTCDKQMSRLCDLKKHEKRHSRPWSCTGSSCYKSFGSKNDWKRHENSQHYQLETWRCTEPSPSSKIGQCAKVFFRREYFQTHLRKDHNKKDEEYIKNQCRVQRIGRNWQSGFWCGFCRAIIRLSKKGLEAWDERFNHIDDMHFKKGQKIEEWYPVDKDTPKGKLRQEQRNVKLTPGAAMDNGSDCDQSDLEDSVIENDSRRDCAPPSDPPALPPQQRPAKLEPQHQAQNRIAKANSTEEWYCEDCSHGPLSCANDVHCTNCSRRPHDAVP